MDTAMEQSKVLRENIISLFLLQGANYILPLLTVPYLVRVLGPDKFGLLAISQSLVQYFILLTDYGFNLSATRLISINRNDSAKLCQIFWSTIWTKLILMIVSFIIMCVIIFSFQKFRNEWCLYFVSFLMVIGNVIFPVWFFQGLEKMKVVSALNILAKAISFLCIFIFVKSENDYIVAATIQSSGMVVGGLFGLHFLNRVAKIGFLWPSLKMVLDALKEGWHIFISTAGISLYISSTPLILGLLAGNVAVGYFSAAQKIIRAVQGLLTPISQAIYPRISALVTRDPEEGLSFIRKTLHLVGSVTFTISLIMILFAKPIVLILLGEQYLESIILVRWMAFIPFAVGLSNLFGVQTMVTFGMKREFSKLLLSAGVFNFCIIFPLIHVANAEGAAISIMITETFVTLSMAIVLHSRGLRLYPIQAVKI